MARGEERRNDPHSRAVDTLVRAGRKAEIAELYDSTAKRAQATYRVIREDDSRSEEWKSAELKRTHDTVRANLTAKLVEMARSADSADQGDVARVFGVAGLPGDAASLVISARDAADRVANTQNNAELRELLERATRIGDEVLARAVVQRAIEQADVNTVNAFSDARENLRVPVERLWSRARRSDGGSFDLTVKLLAVRP